MGDIVNLNDRRKKKAREDKAAGAAANRAKFGRTKGEKKLEEQKRSAEIRRLDGAKRETDTDQGSDV
jgi:hypothetical protein